MINFAYEFDAMSARAHQMSREHGFWEGAPSDGEKIALIHSELSEALEALRNEDPFSPSEKIPAFSNLEEELADTIIRIGDFAASKNLKVGDAILEKMAYNANRKHRHGRRF